MTELLAALSERWPADPEPTTLMTSEVCRRCAQRHAVAVELEDQGAGWVLAERRRTTCQRQAGWYCGG